MEKIAMIRCGKSPPGPQGLWSGPGKLWSLLTRRRFIGVVAVLAVLLVGGSTALADPIVDFNIPPTGTNGQAGAVAYNGLPGGTFHTTTSLTVDTITGFGTPK